MVILYQLFDQISGGTVEGALRDAEGGVGAHAETGAGVEREEQEVAASEDLARVCGDDTEVGEEECARGVD